MDTLKCYIFALWQKLFWLLSLSKYKMVDGMFPLVLFGSLHTDENWLYCVLVEN